MFFHCQYNPSCSKEFRLHRFNLDPKSLSREEPMLLAGPVGALEGRWRPPRADRAPRGVVVVAHPHPVYGGTMQNKVVFHLARVLGHDMDLAALRFNVRGVGASEGHHDEGRGEVEDLLSAWSAAEKRAGTGLLVAAGFSFGAAMTLLAATARAQADARVPDALALAGVPLRLFSAHESIPDSLPLAVVHGERDQFTPPEEVGRWLENRSGPTAFHVVRGADHFFEGCLPEATGFLSDNLRKWL
jgi:alpha/beta superfamily hydrolase